MNDPPTGINLVLKAIISQGCYLEQEIVNKYGSLFFLKLLDDHQKTIFHYQKERPLVPDDLDDLGELGIQVFRCKNRCYLFD